MDKVESMHCERQIAFKFLNKIIDEIDEDNIIDACLSGLSEDFFAEVPKRIDKGNVYMD